MFCFIQNDLGSKLNALKVNDNQILTKVDGNVKKVGELGSEVVSFSRQLFSNVQLSLICFVQDDLGSKVNGLNLKDNQILKKVDGNTKKVGELGSKCVSL